MANDTQFYVLGILLLLVSVRCVPVGATINEMADLIASAANINVVASMIDKAMYSQFGNKLFLLCQVFKNGEVTNKFLRVRNMVQKLVMKFNGQAGRM